MALARERFERVWTQSRGFWPLWRAVEREVKEAFRRGRGDGDGLREAAQDAVRLWREGPLYSSPEFSSAMARLARLVEP